MTERYLEDFEPGQTFGCGRICIDADRMSIARAKLRPALAETLLRGHAFSSSNEIAVKRHRLPERQADASERFVLQPHCIEYVMGSQCSV